MASGLTDLAAYRALTGIFAAAVMPVSLALIGDMYPVHERQGAIGIFMGISFLGQGLSMMTGGAIAYFLNWRGVFAVYALLSLIPVTLIIKNFKSLPDTQNPGSPLFAPYLQLIRRGSSLFTYLLILLEGMFIIGSFSYLGAFIAQTYHFNYLLIGLIMTAFGLMSVIGGRMSGKLSQKANPRHILTAELLLVVAADLLLHYSGRSIGLLVVGVGLLGIGFVFTHSTLLTRATEFAPKSRGAAMSLVAFCFMGGGGVGTVIGGKIAMAYGLSAVFLIYGVALAITLALSFVLITGQVISAPVLMGTKTA